MRYIFFATALLAAVLFQGCSNRDESNDTNTTQTIDPSAQTLELNIETDELPENNETTVTVTTADGRDITANRSLVWHVSDRNATEINGTTLIAKAEGTVTLQAQMGSEYSQEQNITIYKIIHGHRLPPEPDPKINNSTLLGIDSNNNGVRDDVERAIYFRYQRPIEQAFMMQYATRYPIVLEDPEGAAASKPLEQEHWNLYSCWGYLDRFKNIEMPDDDVDFMENAYFNTRERMKAYIKFNDAMSGGVYHIPIHDKDMQKENCDFNITMMLEMEK